MAPDPMRVRVTIAEDVFCRAFVSNGGDRVKALLKAYPHTETWSQPKQITRANAIMQTARVALRIQELIKLTEREFVVDRSRVLQEQASLAFFDPLELFDERGSFRPLAEMPPRVRAAIKSIEVEHVIRTVADPVTGEKVDTIVSVPVKLAFHSKTAALDALMKHLGMYEMDNAQRNAMQWRNMPRDARQKLLGALKERVGGERSGATDMGEESASGRGGRVTH